MRRVIRHLPTNTFFSQGAWVQDVNQAQTFTDTSEVQSAVSRFGLENVELYFVFGAQLDSKWDWSIPLMSAQEPSAQPGE